MTSAHSTTAEVSPAGFVRRGLSANIWLLFLLFPIISVADSDISTTRKSAAIALIVLYAIVHMVGFDEEIRRGMGLAGAPPRSRGPRWFAGLIVVLAVAVAFGGWPVLAVLPFIVSFAMFHFSWRTVIAVLSVCIAISIIAPAIGGVLGKIWFFSIIIAGVGAATALIRIEDQYQHERHSLQMDLAVGDERNRVARDVHDVLGHSLTAVILKAQVCDHLLRKLDRDDRDDADREHADREHADREIVRQAREHLAELDTVSRRALGEIRSTVGGLRSADLVDELTAARAVLADADVELTVIGDPAGFDSATRSTLGWVVRESVTNIVRHARASTCRIELTPSTSGDTRGDAEVLIRIADNGVGLRDAAAGNGLTGLQERLEAAGAQLRTESSSGTVVEVLTGRAELMT